MDHTEYIVSYGVAGEFGRFAPVQPVVCQRGDRVVVRSRRGLELGTVLCPATVGHAHLLGPDSFGQLLRLAEAADEQRVAACADDSQQAFDEARGLCETLDLPIDVLDVEILVEPRVLVVHYLGGPADLRALVSALSRRFDAYVELLALGTPSEAEAEPDNHHHEGEESGCGSCGSGGCGSCGEGGCGSCSEGGCSTSAPTTSDLQQYFTKLRVKMDRQFGSPA